MKQKTVFLLCGIPASGKSTWARAHLSPTTEWISRDNVRFSIVREDEEYFSHEEEVFDTFIAYINQTLENPKVDVIIIDATHISKGSRRKVISRIRKQNIFELDCVWFDVSLDTCLARNHLRTGRERVPETAIENMYKSKTYPSKDEGFDMIFIIDENGISKEVNF